MDNNEYLHQITCVHCGAIDETGLEPSGTKDDGAILHIKSICEHCKEYVRFVSIKELPTIETVRSKVWELNVKDTRMVDINKNLCKFKIKNINDEKEIYISYWNLYLQSKRTVISVCG